RGRDVAVTDVWARISCQSAPVLLVVFFFFQAEDGIRDLTVTGVQTCALPIYQRVVVGEERSPLGRAPGQAEEDVGHEPRLLRHLLDAVAQVLGQFVQRRY